MAHKSSSRWSPKTFNDAPADKRIDSTSYEVYHPEGFGPCPKFGTWKAARHAAKQWNADVPGHIARKRNP